MPPRLRGSWVSPRPPSYHVMYAFACPCGDEECYVLVDRMEFQLGYEVNRVEQHEFWTHDYEGEVDVVTGTVEFS